MKCKAIIRNSEKFGFCSEETQKGKLFCVKHKYWLIWSICIFIFTLVFTFLGNKFLMRVLPDSKPITVTIQIVDWRNRIDNQEIYKNGGIVSFDGKKEYENELTSTNKGKFELNLPVSYKKKKVRVYFQPKEDLYKFMKLDTTIVVYKNTTYYIKMYFLGIDKITRTVINGNTNEPFRDAIVEINGIIDTTDTNGTFTIKLPLVKQERFQKLTIKKDGYADFVNNEFDMTNDNSHISWNFSKK